ncbi:uncharacterized protein LOC101240224 [Hydra vulgaris]|uniref:uncharacterized protein LOC101240224 n=1 Tax=Hydra vulgaris TaxID=6087 RepID=UPI0032EA69DC
MDSENVVTMVMLKELLSAQADAILKRFKESFNSINERILLLQKDVEEIKRGLTFVGNDIETKVNKVDSNMAIIKETIIGIKSFQGKLVNKAKENKRKTVELEDRNRRNNLRIVGVKEGITKPMKIHNSLMPIIHLKEIHRVGLPITDKVVAYLNYTVLYFSGERTASEASKLYNIPRTTLRDKISGKAPVVKKMGLQTYLTEAEENVLVNFIVSAQKRAHPVTKETIMSLVTSLLSDERLLMEVNRDRPFQFGRSGTQQPGNKWYKLFLSRHPNIVARMTESLSANRRNVSQAVIQQWFADIRSYLSEHDLLEILQEPQRNYNIDESGFQFLPKVSKVLAAMGSKNVPYATSSKEKERITHDTSLACLLTFGFFALFFAANVGADGSLPPPLIIYPNLRIPMNVYEAIPSSLFAIGKSESGYINHQVLYEYLTNAFDQWLTQHNIQRPVIVWSDKHESRLQFHLVKTLADLQIMLILIPPNCTHFMQPLDVGLFGPMKNEWAKCVNRFRAANPNEYVTKECFAGMFLPVYTRVMSREKIVKSFKKCGIQPFDQDASDYTKLTLEEAHSGDSRIFEGVLQDGRVEAFIHVNVATQTSSAS